MRISELSKGSTINDLGGAEENSKMNLFFPCDGLSIFVPAEGLFAIFFSRRGLF